MMSKDDLRKLEAMYYLEEKRVAKQTAKLQKKGVRGSFEITDLPCERCGGRQHCMDCAGSGEIERPTGFMTALRAVTGGDQMMECTLCNGTGICRLCKGAGVYPQKMAKLPA